MSEAALPLVSVIVPVRDGEGTLGECLVSILAVDYPEDRREIVVVDNGSTDKTAEIIRALPVRYVSEQRRGHSHARNRGIEASAGKILAFTDADCVVATTWLRELIAGFDSDTALVRGEVVAYPPTTPAERYIASRKPISLDWCDRHRMTWSPLMNLAIRRDVFERIGVFDTRLGGGGEDIDFCWRVRLAGLVLRSRPRSVVFHHHRASARALFRQQMGYGRGQALLFRKYPDQIAWGFGQELEAWRDLAAAGWMATRAGIGLNGGSSSSRDASYLSLDFLRKLAQRLGFLQGLALEALRRG